MSISSDFLSHIPQDLAHR